ncbi:MAG: cupin domain-containing protein [Thermoleophilia bacterium]|nr:cupin domain-containing protein [Gaiellaceae bacterium]MDW8337770.1 cupin domain-containing protein [Thermoleophilia bacterium]
MTPRRIVTGHGRDGRSTILEDGAPPVSRSVPGATFYELWRTSEAPAPLAPREEREPTDRPLVVPPDPGGTVLRIVDLEPQSRSPMHRTETIDYGIVLQGEVILVLDDGTETRLSVGDVVIQRGTSHAWVNPTDTRARMAFVLIAATFAEELRALLPTDLDLFDQVLAE